MLTLPGNKLCLPLFRSKCSFLLMKRQLKAERKQEARRSGPKAPRHHTQSLDMFILYIFFFIYFC